MCFFEVQHCVRMPNNVRPPDDGEFIDFMSFSLNFYQTHAQPIGWVQTVCFSKKNFLRKSSFQRFPKSFSSKLICHLLPK